MKKITKTVLAVVMGLSLVSGGQVAKAEKVTKTVYETENDVYGYEVADVQPDHVRMILRVTKVHSDYLEVTDQLGNKSGSMTIERKNVKVANVKNGMLLNALLDVKSANYDYFYKAIKNGAIVFGSDYVVIGQLYFKLQ